MRNLGLFFVLSQALALQAHHIQIGILMRTIHMTIKLVFALLGGVFLAANLQASTAAFITSPGTPIETGEVDREIAITAQTQWVNVWHNERIRFVNAQNGKRMDWHFDTVRTSSIIDFQPVATALLDKQRITVYVSPDPRLCGH